MKHVFLTLLLFILGHDIAFSQCDEFSKAILQIVKSEQYQDFTQYFEPIEAKRARMFWPNDADATNHLNALNDSLYKYLVSSAKAFRASRSEGGWDLSKATYVNCQRTSGTSSAIKINFKIHNRKESFIVKTFESDKIYLTSELIDGKKGFSTPITTYTVIDNKKYTTFKPRKDELANGLIHLKKYLTTHNISDYTYHCTLGLNDLYAGVFLEYLVMYEDSNMYVLVNLSSGECKEVFK